MTAAYPLTEWARDMAREQRRRDAMTVDEAAQKARCAGGPPLDELARLIAAERAARAR